jgi:hypothetical protein
VGKVLVPVATPHHEAERRTEHGGRQHSPGEQRGDRDAGDRTDGDQDEAGRNGLGLGAGGGEQGDEVAGIGAALAHLGEKHRCHRRHVGGLRSRDAGNEIHGSDEHVVEAATHMPQETGQEGHHGASHAGHLDQ